MDSSSLVQAHDPGLTDAVAHNLAAALGHFHRHTAGTVLEQAADLVYADSGIADPAFNAVGLNRLDPRTADARIRQIVARMRATGRPFTWWVGPEAIPADLGARLLAAGLTLAESAPLMMRDLARPLAPTAIESGFEIREVKTDQQWSDFVDVMMSRFDPPSLKLRGFLLRARSSTLAPDSPGRFVVGYVGAMPACSAEVLLHSGVAVVFNVVTRPECQRRGFAAAATTAVLDIARAQGYRTVALTASQQGEPVYRRLGFDEVGRYQIYEIGG